jgi:hypothetical protein
MKSAILGAVQAMILATLTCSGLVMGPAIAAAAEDEVALGTPVEDDMHEFMEYVFQPTYQRLKASMAELSAEKANWGAIKSDALILAEASNLLGGRGEFEDEVWLKHAAETRKAGASLYRAAKAKSIEQARAEYKSMLGRCNACHDDFAQGEHQLEP